MGRSHKKPMHEELGVKILGSSTQQEKITKGCTVSASAVNNYWKERGTPFSRPRVVFVDAKENMISSNACVHNTKNVYICRQTQKLTHMWSHTKMHIFFPFHTSGFTATKRCGKKS